MEKSSQNYWVFFLCPFKFFPSSGDKPLKNNNKKNIKRKKLGATCPLIMNIKKKKMFRNSMMGIWMI
jgi:hypothetical protein